MLTVTVPNQDLVDRLSDLAGEHGHGGVRLVPWDLRGPLPDGVDPADVGCVVIPNVGVTAEHFRELHTLPNLRVVQLASAGYDHVVPRLPVGVMLCNGRGVHDAGTAELAIALTLASQRGVDDAVRAMGERRWAPGPRASLADRRVMVLGYGSIGAAVGRRLEAFEAEVVAVASTARRQDGRCVHGVDELPDLLAGVDIVILTLPLTEATTGLVDAAFMALLPDGALVVNVGRGKLVDTDALLAELTAGRLRAGLDVTDPEPLPADHPLWAAPGALITPHLGGYSDATTPRLAALLRRQVGALLAGREPENVVART